MVLNSATHSLHPIASQGFNLSLRGILTLVDTLLHDDAPLGKLTVLQRYPDGQHLGQQMTVGFSGWVTQLFSSNHMLLSVEHNLGLLGFGLLLSAKRWFACQATGLDA